MMAARGMVVADIRMPWRHDGHYQQLWEKQWRSDGAAQSRRRMDMEAANDRQDLTMKVAKRGECGSKLRQRSCTYDNL